MLSYMDPLCLFSAKTINRATASEWPAFLKLTYNSFVVGNPFQNIYAQ